MNEAEVMERIRQAVSDHKIIIFMKGSPEQPMCGFSAKAVQMLKQCGAEFAHIDILQNPDIRATLPKYADWPTFPQVFVNGELIGGCDIVVELQAQGELQKIVDEAMR